MPSADEVIASVEAAKSSMETARAEFLHAKLQAEELSAALSAAGAEGTAGHASAAASSIEQADGAVGGVVSLADEAITHLMAVKGVLLAVVANTATPQHPSATAVQPVPSKPRSSSVVIDSGKFRYLLGFVKSGEHNTSRSSGMQRQFARVGIYSNPAGREHLQNHFVEVAGRDDNVMKTYSDQYGSYEVRDSLFCGPTGFLHFESHWQITDTGRRLTTVIPRGGKH